MLISVHMSDRIGSKSNYLSAAMALTLGLFGGPASLLATTVNTTVLSASNLTCNTNTTVYAAQSCGTFGVSGEDSVLAATADGLEGVKFYLSSGFVDNENNGADSTVLTLTSSGTATGSGELAGIMVPFTYDFTLGASGTGSLASYSLLFNIQQGQPRSSLPPPRLRALFRAKPPRLPEAISLLR